MPLALITAVAAGDVRKAMNALAASASLLACATAAVNRSSCCNSAGNEPASSTPGAISTLVRNTPSSASPLATACGIAAGVACDAIADARDIDGRPGHEARLGGSVLEHIDGDNAEVERRVGGDSFDQV